ncbi:MAG: hypothetical protein QGG40_17250 [Myxococcota bacterium]|jgi:hypothetical protein|nr:hypothetical protein [Myxococcota bacterium]
MIFPVTELGASALIFSSIVSFIVASLVSGLAEHDTKSPGNPPDNG